MRDVAIVLAVVAVWFLLQMVILPYFGVST